MIAATLKPAPGFKIIVNKYGSTGFVRDGETSTSAAHLFFVTSGDGTVYGDFYVYPENGNDEQRIAPSMDALREFYAARPGVTCPVVLA